MKKKETLKFLRKQQRKGYIIHPFIIENMFDDEEDIPQVWVDLCHKKPITNPYIIHIGPLMQKVLDEVMEDYWKAQTI